MHHIYTVCMFAQLLVMSDHSLTCLTWSDIHVASDQAIRIIMHTACLYHTWYMSQWNTPVPRMEYASIIHGTCLYHAQNVPVSCGHVYYMHIPFMKCRQ